MQNLIQLKTPKLNGTSVEQKRKEIKEYFLNTWETYESLFALINDDKAYYLKPELLRHPLIFYFGHTAVFYINKLILGKYIEQRINGRLEAICAVGVDEMSWDDLDSNHYEWPHIDELRQYRGQVKTLILELIALMPLELPVQQDSLAWIILMGCEHERIHIETSSVIMRMLDAKYLQQHSNWQACLSFDKAPENKMLHIASAEVELGKPNDNSSFGWDNEYGHCKVQVEQFETSKYLVSNQEFMEFVLAGGYKKTDFWTSEGQQWLKYSKAVMPRFWLKKGNEYYQRNLLNECKLPMNWPVEVNNLEAKAFCNWRSKTDNSNTRLLTEPEWFVLRQHIKQDSQDWSEMPGNTNLEYFASPCPVNCFETLLNGQSIFDLVGNVWQWTESAIDGFTDFEVHPLYDDFSTPTFDGRHNLIKGGSWISTGNETIKHARYAFRRHFFQHAGFRYVVSEQDDIPIIPVNQYEKNIDVCLQLQVHYGNENRQSQNQSNHNYFKQCVDRIMQYVAQSDSDLTTKIKSNNSRVLDLGCSVGRSSFELAQYFSNVDGIDFSARFLQHGVKLQQTGLLRFVQPTEGELLDYHEVNIDTLGFESIKNNIHFSQGDACNLKAIHQGYEAVVAINLLEKLYEPAKFLRQIHHRLNAGGLLIIVSDYHWTIDCTPKDKWISGIKINGENVVGLAGLKLHLHNKFYLVCCQSIEKSVQLDQRRALLSNNEMTIWRLK